MARAMTKTIATAQTDPKNQIARRAGGLKRDNIERSFLGREAGVQRLSAAGGLKFPMPTMSTAYSGVGFQPHEFVVRFRNRTPRLTKTLGLG